MVPGKTDEEMPVNAKPTPLRRSGAVFAGLLFIFVTSLGTDSLLHATGVFPPWGQPMSDRLFLLALAYRVVFAVAGSYLTARLAPDHPMRHALTLGAIGVALSIIGAVATWNRGPEFGPHWYPLALVATSIPCSWAGGKLLEIQRQNSPPRKMRNQPSPA